MYDSSAISCSQFTESNNFRQVFIQEKNASSGVSFTLTNTTTVGDICAIVARVLNCNGEISVQMSEQRLSNEINVGDFDDATIKQITYSIIANSSAVPSSSSVTGVVGPYFHWSVSKDTEGNRMLKFSNNNQVWNFNINNTEITSPKLHINEPANYSLKDYISSERPLYKIEDNVPSYLKDIAILKNMEKPGEALVLPRRSWIVYLVKGDKYHLIGCLNKEFTTGDIASLVGRSFSVRVGKITIGDQNEHETTLNVPLPPSHAGLFEKVVVEHNLTDLVASSGIITPSTNTAIHPIDNPKSFSNSCSSTASSTNDLSIALAKLSLARPQSPLAQTEIASPKVHINEPANYSLKEYISSERKLYKIEDNVPSYLKDIAILKNMEKPGEALVLPRRSWIVYLVKGDKYHLIGCLNKEFTTGDIASLVGRSFSVRVGKITIGDQNEHETTLNVPLPPSHAGLFDKVVVEHNLTDLIAST